jgi:hypothetical protein
MDSYKFSEHKNIKKLDFNLDFKFLGQKIGRSSNKIAVPDPIKTFRQLPAP